MAKEVKKIKIDMSKHKMSEEELKIHQHIQRKGGVPFASKKDYKRQPKHKNKIDY